MFLFQFSSKGWTGQVSFCWCSNCVAKRRDIEQASEESHWTNGIAQLANPCHRITYGMFTFAIKKNQVNILLGKYIEYTVHWSYIDFKRETVLCLPTSMMGYHPPKCQDCAAAAAILTDPFSCSLRQGGLRRHFKLESDSLLKKCTGSWVSRYDLIWDFEIPGNSHVHIVF